MRHRPRFVFRRRGADRRRAIRGEPRPVRRTARFDRGVSRAPDPLHHPRGHALRRARQRRAAGGDEGYGMILFITRAMR